MRNCSCGSPRFFPVNKENIFLFVPFKAEGMKSSPMPGQGIWIPVVLWSLPYPSNEDYGISIQELFGGTQKHRFQFQKFQDYQLWQYLVIATQKET
jgi:hypothetical protein